MIYRATLLIWILLLSSGCEQLLFHPDTKVYSTPDRHDLAYEDIRFESADGTLLHAWQIRPTATPLKGMMVLVHGNAQNISAHYEPWVWLVKAGYGLFIFDYRGYGKSEGKTDLGLAIDDTVAALHYAKEKYAGMALFVCGQSLGGMLLINALSREPFDAYQFAIVDSSFSELEPVVERVLANSIFFWPFQWIGKLFTDAYDPIDRLADISIPLLFVAGSRDAVIAPNESWVLFDHAKRPKEFWLVQDAEHIRVFDEPAIRSLLLGYLKTYPHEDQPSTLKIFDNLDKIPKN